MFSRVKYHHWYWCVCLWLSLTGWYLAIKCSCLLLKSFPRHLEDCGGMETGLSSANKCCLICTEEFDFTEFGFLLIHFFTSSVLLWSGIVVARSGSTFTKKHLYCPLQHPYDICPSISSWDNLGSHSLSYHSVFYVLCSFNITFIIIEYFTDSPCSFTFYVLYI